MALRIDDSFSASNDARSTQIGRTQEIPPDQEVRQRQSEPGSDSVSLSSLGEELARAIANEPPDVVKGIERLQEAVSNGSFSAPAQEVASALVEDALRASEFENQQAEAQQANQTNPPSPLER